MSYLLGGLLISLVFLGFGLGGLVLLDIRLWWCYLFLKTLSY